MKNIFWCYPEKSNPFFLFMLSFFPIFSFNYAFSFVFMLFLLLTKQTQEKIDASATIAFLLAAQAFSFLIHPIFLNIVSQASLGTLPLTVQDLCYLADTMLLIGQQVLPTLPLQWEVEEFPRCDKYVQDVSLSIYLHYSLSIG